MNNNYCFIIPTCLRENKHIESLKRCINSIYKYHNDTKIILIIDYTSTLDYKDDRLYKIEKTTNTAADMSVYYFFNKNEYAQKCIMIQDSMEITSKFIDLPLISFLWQFKNHYQWSIIEEPYTEYNIINNIKTHDDLIIHLVKNIEYSNVLTDSFKKYVLDNYYRKELWYGCFGCCCIMDINYLKILDKLSGIINFMLKMNDNRKRRAIESIFSLACLYVSNELQIKIYDGLYFDGINGNNGESKHIKKYSYNRQ